MVVQIFGQPEFHLDAILEGYQDAIDGRIHAFKGDLRSLLSKVQ